MRTRAEIKESAKAQLGRNIFGNNWLMALLVCFIFAAIVSAAATVLPGIGGIVVYGPLTFGLAALFLKQTYDGQAMEVGGLFAGFQSDFGGTLLLGLMESIFVFLWSLLFIIPGIVKSYSYRMAFYIKNDNPQYEWKQCLDASKALTNGHKWDLFMLDLSFIGWYIVGSLCLGVGTLWVIPYHMASDAQFYRDLCAAQQGMRYAG